LGKSDLVKSRQVFEAWIRALPNDPVAHQRLGLIARAERKDAEALSHFEAALAASPRAIEPLYEIASIKSSQGKWQEAKDRVLRQLTQIPDSAPHHNLLGRIWMAGKDLPQAEAEFKKAIEIDNKELASFLNLAEVYYAAGKVDHAIAEYEAALKKNPKLIMARVMLGIIHEQRKDLAVAQRQYEEALKINPEFAPAANNLAWVMVERGENLDVALSHAEMAREKNPNDPYIADTLGWIYYQKGVYLKAVRLLKEAAQKLTTYPIVQYHFGMAQYKSGDKAGAKQSLQNALRLNQTFPGAEDARKTLAQL
jgi:tetratricopeptide (TPR) repeat protein